MDTRKDCDKEVVEKIISAWKYSIGTSLDHPAMILGQYREILLREAADRAMMWWYEGDKAMTEMNQINSLRAAIMEDAK